MGDSRRNYKKAHENGLPVSLIYDIVEIDGRPAVVME
jgi:hypothetical protein